MVKALLKKQLLEFFSGFFMNVKTGKAHTKMSKVGFGLLFVFLFMSFGMMFYYMAAATSKLILTGNLHLYFSVFGILASLIGIMGSVFLTFNTLYEAKDNDLLLSMPILPKYILMARLFGLYLTTITFEALVLIPAFIVYMQIAEMSIISVAFYLINMFVLPLVALGVACILGWLIALFSSKIRNKGIITVVLSVAFVGLYYFFSMKMNVIISLVVEYSEEIDLWLRHYLYPLWAMGKGCSGDIFTFLIYLAFVVVFFGIITVVLSKSFIKLATTKKGLKKKKYVEKQVKQDSLKIAFLKKEFIYFKSTPAYMLNCGMGALLIIVFAFYLVIKKYDLLTAFYMMQLPGFDIAVLLCISVSFLSSTVSITSPSISLEAKNLWFLKSIPIDIGDVLFSKLMLHFIVAGVPLLIANVIVFVSIASTIPVFLLSVVFSLFFMLVCAQIGLVANLVFPKLDWTNETVPIKQSLASFIGMFFGLLLTLIVVGVYFFVSPYIDTVLFLGLCSAVFIVISLMISKWIFTKGKKRFMSLQ